MSVDDVQDRFTAMRKVVVNNLFSNYISTEQAEEDWDVEGLYHALKSDYAADFPLQEWLDEGLDVDELVSRIDQGLVQIFEYKEKVVGSEQMRGFEKAVMLQTLDHFWKEHLAAMDYLRQSISLRGYAQKNPTQEYKRESFTMFTTLLDTIDTEIVKALSSVAQELGGLAMAVFVFLARATRAGVIASYFFANTLISLYIVVGFAQAPAWMALMVL
jgi:preprotein translocase subunit SecA